MDARREEEPECLVFCLCEGWQAEGGAADGQRLVPRRWGERTTVIALHAWAVTTHRVVSHNILHDSNSGRGSVFQPPGIRQTPGAMKQQWSVDSVPHAYGHAVSHYLGCDVADPILGYVAHAEASP